ncbi:hypothetical protein AB0D32_11010 [Micromonospora sp. NPDC048170]|uniref:hypothetical protein n=1 Tax=Micromonospora sp. NPDC048170 TaxID=3154819 RepID=UPI0033C596EE
MGRTQAPVHLIAPVAAALVFTDQSVVLADQLGELVVVPVTGAGRPATTGEGTAR